MTSRRGPGPTWGKRSARVYRRKRRHERSIGGRPISIDQIRGYDDGRRAGGAT